ncbi:MAG: hypothetical protein IPL79_17240 [Myxococcales bacterium]|nr:hypothetical protein [Myxococcales bacterium]
MPRTLSNCSSHGSRASWRLLVGSALAVALAVAPAHAWAEDEGDDESDEAAPDEAGEPKTGADRSNVKSDFTALPAGVWLVRDQALWHVGTKGGAPKRRGHLPGEGGDATALMASPSGKTLAVEVSGGWWYGLAPGDGKEVTWKKLPCAAQVTLHDDQVFCLLDAARQLWGAGALPLAKPRTLTLPAGAQANLLHNGDLVWTSPTGVMRAKGLDIAHARVVGAEAPRERFAVAPDGTVALGRFDATVRQAGVKTTAPRLFSLRLDGASAKRRSTHDAKPIAWSEDAQWVLVQDDDKACIIAATGGHYRCFEHHTALDISPSGEWALMREATGGKLLRGQRSGTKAPPPVAISSDAATLAIWDHR